MNRRDFLTKASLSTIGAGSIPMGTVLHIAIR